MIGQCSFCDSKIENLNVSNYHTIDKNHLYFHSKCWIKVISLLNLTSVITSDFNEESKSVSKNS